MRIYRFMVWQSLRICDHLLPTYSVPHCAAHIGGMMAHLTSQPLDVSWQSLSWAAITSHHFTGALAQPILDFAGRSAQPKVSAYKLQSRSRCNRTKVPFDNGQLADHSNLLTDNGLIVTPLIGQIALSVGLSSRRPVYLLVWPCVRLELPRFAVAKWEVM